MVLIENEAGVYNFGGVGVASIFKIGGPLVFDAKLTQGGWACFGLDWLDWLVALVMVVLVMVVAGVVCF